MSILANIDLIDSHCHLDFDNLTPDLDAVMARAAGAGVRACIIPAIDLGTARQSLALCERYPGVYAAAGVHPNSTADFGPQHVESLDELLATGKYVAVGEIGLDYHWNDSPREMQLRALEHQLELAARHNLPVIIHNREASDDVLAVLEAWAAILTGDLKALPGVLHSFSGSPVIATRALAAGFYLGFTGPLTYRKADQLRAIAAAAPLDRILVETDSPFLTPEPHRGQRNEPSYVRLVAERLAAVRGASLADVAAATTANAVRLFTLPS
ncbi:MAG: TatD family hydrolase [Anaerolineae bacterium]|nr:TatD family hydrolase [Anaerolineae bacterium]